jgi:poly(A) polymerase
VSSRATPRHKPSEAPMSASNTFGGTGEVITASWLTSEPMAAVFQALITAGGEARAVGGAVRNTLLNRPVADIDIATTLLPGDVLRIARENGLEAHPTGIEHGTITVVSADHPYEVTTLRRDVETDGRRAVVAFTRDWAEDAARRDFTINALYAAPDGQIFDYTGGRADLTAGRVRFIGDARQRIREDYLRILRFFRFCAEYGRGPVDASGLAACRDLKAGIEQLSAERIGVETLKLLGASRAGEIVSLMVREGILKSAVGLTAGTECFSRLVAIERTLSVKPDPVVRLAALVQAGPEYAPELVRRLRLSNADAAILEAALAPERAYSPAEPEATARALLYRVGAEAYRRGARIAWARSTAPENDNGFKARATLPERWTPPALPVRGSDIIALGVPAGPHVGQVLKAFENWWIETDFNADAAAQRAALNALTGKS